MNVERFGALELRQYTLYGGRRDELMRLFRRELITPQNALGAQVIGNYRDLDDPDRFVWLRGFADMATRAKALESFYGGEVWARFRNAANATMRDSDNVLLLKPLQPADSATLTRMGADQNATLRVAVHYLSAAQLSPFTDFFMAEYLPRASAAGAVRIATFVTEASENNFPKLPIRAGEHVLAWFAELADERQLGLFSRNLASLSGWRDRAAESLLPALARKPEVLRLSP